MRTVLSLVLAGAVAVGLAVAAAAQPKPDGVKGHVPSLADLMLLVQIRHAKLWLAGQAGNWELANFAVHEMEEGLEDMAKLHPTYKDSPTGPMIEGSMKAPIEAVEKAIKSADRKAFASAFDKLTAACNGCHQSTNHAFIVIQRPSGSPFPNQSFAPAKK